MSQQETKQQQPKAEPKPAKKETAKAAPQKPEDLPIWPGAQNAEPGKSYRTVRGNIIKV
jgi:hypothetical protein